MKFDAQKLIETLKIRSKILKTRDLAGAMHIGQSAFSMWKTERGINWNRVFALCEEKKINIISVLSETARLTRKSNEEPPGKAKRPCVPKKIVGAQSKQ